MTELSDVYDCYNVCGAALHHQMALERSSGPYNFLLQEQNIQVYPDSLTEKKCKKGLHTNPF